MNRKKDVLFIFIGFFGALAGCFAVIMFNKYIMMSIPLIGRMICMLLTYWLIALVPIVLMCISKEKIDSLKIPKEKIGIQILLGIIGGLLLASAYFLVPFFLGFGSFVDNGRRYSRLFQFAFELLYFTVSVGAVEEIVFRGFIYDKLKKACENEWVAIIISSVLFGLFHTINGNIIQVCLTAIIGFIFCIIRYKVKHFSIISLILMHGIYDFMLTLYSSLLIR